jgi:diguanylate cyclase (GGDEF)-like protein
MPVLARWQELEVQPLGEFDHGARYEIAWRSMTGGEPLTFLARIDASHVRRELYGYLARVAGLVAIIVVVVTAGTMLVLHVWVLQPLLRLRRSMLGAGGAPDQAASFTVPVQRSDELGEVMAAHNRLLAQVADSMRRDREMAEERARFLTRHDTLTGLPNRAALIEQLDRDVQGGGSLFVIGLVGFRRYSAGFGQAASDRLLRELGRCLQGAGDAGAFVARLEADRFALLSTSAVGVSAAAAFAERILGDIARVLVRIGADNAVAVRIGISAVAHALAQPSEMLDQAELAHGRAREDDVGQYQFFAPEMAEQARERQAIARDLEQALQGDEFFLVYQPRVAISTISPDVLTGAEALVRWRHPRRGLVAPDTFIAVAEATGLILPLGDIVLKAACAQVRDWQLRHGGSPRVAVNLSAHQFAMPDLTAQVAQAIEEAGIPAAALELEITETAAMRDVERTAAKLRELRALGVHVSIDDFGTGYSSMNYLRRFDIDAIKIDKSFVDDLGRDGHAEAICEAIIGIGRALDKRVVAEGVEREDQLRFLREKGCDEIQGYYFGKPMPAADFEAGFLQGRRGALPASFALVARASRGEAQGAVPVVLENCLPAVSR